jgi:xylulokinase
MPTGQWWKWLYQQPLMPEAGTDTLRSLCIGLDIGSSSTKGVLVDRNGSMLAATSRQHATSHPHPGWHEQAADAVWWQESISIIHELLARGTAAPAEVDWIGVTGLVPGLCLLDSHGQSLRPAILHSDTRADAELAMIRQYNPTVHHGQLTPKLLWVQRHEPAVFAAIQSVLVPHSFIVYRLTGVLSCDYDTATIHGGIFDDGQLQWDQPACASLGIPLRMLPQPMPADIPAGQLTAESARILGLTEATRVIVGTGDSFATLIGSGINQPNATMLYWGTSGTRIRTIKPPDTYTGGPYFNGGKADFVGSIFSCGGSLDHLRRLLGHPDLPSLNAMAGTIQPGADGLLYIPHLKQQCSADTTGAADHLLGLSDTHGPAHLYRALLEGIAFTSVSELLHLEHPHGVRVCGGAAACDLLRSMVAALLRQPVYYNPQASAALGITLLAAAAMKRESFQDLSAAWFPPESQLTHVTQAIDTAWNTTYRKLLDRFMAVRKALPASLEPA